MISSRVHANGLTAHWSGETGSDRTLCGREIMGSLSVTARMCASCAKHMDRMVKVAHAEALSYVKPRPEAMDAIHAFALKLNEQFTAERVEKLTPAFVAAGDNRPRCGAERSGTWPCIRLADECQGSHYDKLGRTWTDQDHIRPALRCAAVPPAGHALCVIPATNMPVAESAPHEGGYRQHRDAHGREWETPVASTSAQVVAVSDEWSLAAEVPAEPCAHGIDASRKCSICIEDAQPCKGCAETQFGITHKRECPEFQPVQVHTAGELHPDPEMPAPDFVFNLSRLLDDPARKPNVDLVKLDGLDHRMQDFVFFTEGALDLYEDMVHTITRQVERGKSVVVLILCRGGKHRSVAFGENLAAHFDAPVTHHHRELDPVDLSGRLPDSIYPEHDVDNWRREAAERRNAERNRQSR